MFCILEDIQRFRLLCYCFVSFFATLNRSGGGGGASLIKKSGKDHHG